MAYTTTSYMPLKMPTPGTREPANIALLNENAVVLSGHDHSNGKGLPVTVLRAGLEANRPAAGNAGAVYLATDTGQFYVDTGTAWASFLTSGGSATVTGWTLVDPIVRDTLSFGPEPTGAADATIARTSAGTLRVDTTLGVGVAPLAWDVAYRTLSIGMGGAIYAHAGFPQVALSANTYIDTAGEKRYIANGLAASILLGQDGVFYFDNAINGAAGAPATMRSRMRLSAAGTLTLTPDAGAQSIDLQQQATDVNAVPSVMIRRGAPASQHQTIRFQNGAALGDFDIGRRAGSDDLRFMFWNGASLTDRFIFTPGGSMIVGAGGGSDPSVRISSNQSSAPPGAVVDIEMQNSGSVGIDYHQFAAAKWGLLYGLAGGYVRLGQDIGWGIPAVQVYAGGGGMLLASGGVIDVQSSSGYFRPTSDGGVNFGHPSQRIGTVFAVTGAINTCVVEAKRDFKPLDPEACVEAVLATDWMEYTYLPPPLPEIPEDPEAPAPNAAMAYDEHDSNEVKSEKKARRDKDEAEKQARHAKMLVETQHTRHQKGYVLGSDDYRVSDLFGLDDRASASPGSDLAVVACALQDALRRLAVLEGTDAAPA